MKDSDPIDFGKHKGDKLGDVPASYLLWLYEQTWMKEQHPDIYDYIEANIASINQDAIADKYEGGDEGNAPWEKD